MLTMDKWDSSVRDAPKYNHHLTGRTFTQHTERLNLTLRTRINRLTRKTIGFSRSVELYVKITEAFTEKYIFY